MARPPLKQLQSRYYVAKSNYSEQCSCPFMRTQRAKHPKPDNLHRVRFDRNTALATGISAALVLAPEWSFGESQRTSNVSYRSEWKATAPGINPVTDTAFLGEASELPTLQSRSDEQRWTEAEQKRFQELAVEEAVGSLNPEDAQELEQLTILRRAFDKPRSGDEVLWEFEQRRRTSDLLKTLRRYVEFYEGPHPAWTAAN
jgi:hypothetical protein